LNAFAFFVFFAVQLLFFGLPKIFGQLFAQDRTDRFKPDAGLPQQGGRGGDLAKATLILDALK
jgi:hypothetical protein